MKNRWSITDEKQIWVAGGLGFFIMNDTSKYQVPPAMAWPENGSRATANTAYISRKREILEIVWYQVHI